MEKFVETKRSPSFFKRLRKVGRWWGGVRDSFSEELIIEQNLGG